MEKATPIGIKDVPEPDGSYCILIRTPAGETIEVAFSDAQALHFVHTIQKALLENWAGREAMPRYPRLVLRDANIAHGVDESGLLLSMDEIGSVVLASSGALLAKLRYEIDRLIEMKGERSRPQ